jgi:hypothetical protein
LPKQEEAHMALSKTHREKKTAFFMAIRLLHISISVWPNHTLIYINNLNSGRRFKGKQSI